MDGASISALAALGGSVIGGLTASATAWLNQQAQAKAQGHIRTRVERERLYHDFIVEASRLYGDAIVHDKTEISTLVGMYAMISQMRIVSSTQTIESAERVVERIVGTYLEPNRTLRDLQHMLDDDAMDPLRSFSRACREELNALR
jgi:hypothetical protein